MERTAARSLPVWLLLLATLGAVIGFCWSERDYVAASVLAASALAGLWGYLLGAWRQCGYLAGLAAAWAWGPAVGQRLIPYVQQFFGLPGRFAEMITPAVGGTAVLLLVTAAAAIVGRSLLRNRPRTESANRLLGFGVGGCQGLILAWLLLGAILAAEPRARQHLTPASTANGTPLVSTLARRVVEISDPTRASTLGLWLVAWNPFENMESLRELGRVAAVAGSAIRFATTERGSRSNRS